MRGNITAGPMTPTAAKFDPSMPTVEALERFASVAPGVPFPRTREQWAGLPMHVQGRAGEVLPQLAEAHAADHGRLPAEVEARLQRGALTRADVPDLQRAGFVGTAAEVEAAAQQAVFRQWDEHLAEQRAAMAAAVEADQARLAQAQQEGAERAQAAARADWAASLGGRPNPRMAAVMALGALQPGPRA